MPSGGGTVLSPICQQPASPPLPVSSDRQKDETQAVPALHGDRKTQSKFGAMFQY